jgi:NAD(P)-dependent dehydrogenase (short-subunit alcohol dehydrogenase family)
VTGASSGLGRALADALVQRGWSVVVDARDPARLAEAARAWGAAVTTLPGDVTGAGHRHDLAAAARARGGAALLVANASDLGPSPLPPLAALPLEAFRRLLDVDLVAPLALLQLLLPQLQAHAGTVVHVSSDAAVEAYPGWGGYGAAKAALDQLTAVAAAENPGLRVHAFDPGDMRTPLHQSAFPGEDISDRPEPHEQAVPALLRLVEQRLPSGRYRASDLLAGDAPVGAAR